jgi:hypothetical protein
MEVQIRTRQQPDGLHLSRRRRFLHGAGTAERSQGIEAVMAHSDLADVRLNLAQSVLSEFTVII